MSGTAVFPRIRSLLFYKPDMTGAICKAEKNQIVNRSCSSIIPASQFIDDSVVPQFLELKNCGFFFFS